MDDALPSPTQHSRSHEAPPDLRDGVKALVSSTDGVLLVKERHASGAPFWTLPGGGLAPGETFRAGLRRELREELRTRSSVGERLTSFRYRHRSQQNTVTEYAVFRCSLRSTPSPVESEGIEACRWAPPDALPVETLPEIRTLVTSAEVGSPTTAESLMRGQW